MSEEQSKEKKKHQEKETDESGSSELEKYWQVVRDNPADFPGWTYLLHFVEQENNIEAAREAFCAFFARYPYCYGYWKKYADMEKSLNSTEAAEKVFEDGVKAIPLSVDLWIHYLNFFKALHKDKEDYYVKVKQLFKRALDAAGQEFRSDRLWDAYVTWEEENNMLKEITAAYDALLTIPTQLYSHHFDKFCKHVKNNYPRDILTVDEFLELRQEVMSSRTVGAHEDDEDDGVASEKASGDALPPGVESIDDAPPGLEAPEKIEKDMMTEDEISKIKKKIIEKRKVLHESNEVEVGRRWTFEEGIKRPYFHVKALERAQLKNWKDYLNFEIENGSHNRVVILFERCMIACALYEDMWLKYAKYMEQQAFDDAADVYERACNIHLPKKPTIHFAWATYEEIRDNPEKALEILENLGKNIPELIEVMCRQVNIERRRNNTVKIRELYAKFITDARSVNIATAFAKKFSRYLYKVERDFGKAKDVLKQAITQDPTNPTLYLQLADVAFQESPVDEKSFCEAIDLALASDVSDEMKLIFSRRKLEFTEDFGTEAKSNQLAYEEHSKRMKNYNVSRKRAVEESGDDAEKSKKAKTEMNGVTSAASAATADAASAAALSAGTNVSSQDAAYYHQSAWMGYQPNSYNYHQSWNPYHSSYYSAH